MLNDSNEVKKLKFLCCVLSAAVILLLASLVSVSIWADKLDTTNRELVKIIRFLS